MNASDVIQIFVVVAASGAMAALITSLFQRRKIKAETQHLSADAAATLTRTATELIDPYRQELRRARSEVHEARSEVARLRKTNRRLQEELEETREELHRLRLEARVCEREIEALRDQVSSLLSRGD